MMVRFGVSFQISIFLQKKLRDPEEIPGFVLPRYRLLQQLGHETYLQKRGAPSGLCGCNPSSLDPFGLQSNNVRRNDVEV